MDPFDLRLWDGFAGAGGDLSTPMSVEQVTIDSRRIDTKHTLFIALEGKTRDGHQFISHAAKCGARFAIAKKGFIPPNSLKGITILYVDNPLLALQSIAGAYRKQLPCLVVGIAGSYGKTMVKDLLLLMVGQTRAVAASPESFNSQIGVPLSLLTVKKSDEIALIEVGISKKNEMSLLSEMIAADCGIITHIGKKHLATLETLEATANETVKLFSFSKQKNWALIPDDPYLTPHTHTLANKCHLWNVPSPIHPHATFISLESGSEISYCLSFPDGHQHNGTVSSGFYYFLDLINMSAKAAWLLGASSQVISSALKNFTPETMRTEIWKAPTGQTFINDIYCSDPQSVDQALKFFDIAPSPNRKCFIFGGMRSSDHHHLQNDYQRVGKAIHQANIDSLVLFGNHPFEPLVEKVKKLAPQVKICLSRTYKEALDLVKRSMKTDDVVLIKGAKKESFDTLTETFNDSICNNQCVVNLAAIASNLTLINNRLPSKTRFMVIVKALAYGTDNIYMSKFLETCGISILGVSHVDEGVSLKRAGVRQAVFVVNAAIYEAKKVIKWNLEISVSDKRLIEALAKEAVCQNKQVKVHLHIDTGMSRFGCRPEEALALAGLIKNSPSLEFEGLMTHLACADDPEEDAFTLAQVAKFDAVIAELKAHDLTATWNHVANSSGALRFFFPQFNMVRIGLAIYGLYPSQAVKETIGLRPALSLISRITGINVCKKDESISYSRRYLVEKNQQRIAVLPIGYFDGLHRNYSGKSSVIIRGQKAPMVGNICMDFMMVDITDIPNAAVGDSVLIFGEDEYGNHVSPEDLATSGSSIAHELITCLGPRLSRIFVYEEGRDTF